MAQERAAFSIMDGARFSLEQVQYLSSIDEDRPLGIETDEVQKFLFYWDQVFLYGLKSIKKGYWAFVSAISHPSLINEVSSMPGAVNDLLRSRLWLGTILNDNELENYLTIIQYEQKLLAKFYRPYAILRKKGQLEDLISISCGQENTLFAIHLDHICFRSNQLFIGPDDSSSYNKLFDIRFNWEESIRSRSSSCVSSYSTSGGLPRRAQSYGNYHQLPGSLSNTPVGDLAITADILEESSRMLSVNPIGAGDNSGYIQFSPSVLATVSPLSCSPNTTAIAESKEKQVESQVTFPSDKTASLKSTKTEVGQVLSDSPVHSPVYQILVVPVSPTHENTAESPSLSPQQNLSLFYSSHLSNVSEASCDPLSLSSTVSANKTPVGTPKSQGTPISYGSPTSHGTPDSLGTPKNRDSRRSSHDRPIIGDVQQEGLTTSSSPDLSLSQRTLSLIADPFLHTDIFRSENEPLQSKSSTKHGIDEFLLHIEPEFAQNPHLSNEDHNSVQPVLVGDPYEVDGGIDEDTAPPTTHDINENVDNITEVHDEAIENKVTSVEEIDDLYSDTEADDNLPVDFGQECDDPVEEQDTEDEQPPEFSPTEFIDTTKLICSTNKSKDSQSTPPSASREILNLVNSKIGLKTDIEIFEIDQQDFPPLSSSPVLLVHDEPFSCLPSVEHATVSTDPFATDSNEPFEAAPTPILDEITSENIQNEHILSTSPDSPVDSFTEADRALSSSPEDLFPSSSATPFQLIDASDDNPLGYEESQINADEDVLKIPPSSESELYSGKSSTFPSMEASIEEEVPDFSNVFMNRNLGVTVPTQNQKISWNLDLFEGNEEICFMYRIWLKDEAGNLDCSYFLLTTKTIYLFSPHFMVKKRIKLSEVSYGRGMNWQIITLFAEAPDRSTEQTDVITGCEAISRGIMEGLSFNINYPVNWSLEESYSQMRLKYHVGTFLQQHKAFSILTMDDIHYCVVSWLSLSGPPSSVMEFPISEGKLWLKEPSYLTYVWKEYYFILDKKGKFSQMDTDCAGTIKKEYTVIGSGGCRKMTRKETSKTFAFKFISEEGVEVMLNCESAVERDRWMSAISKTAMEVPQVTNEGIQCSTVVTNKFIVVVREGIKKAHTIDFAHMEEVTEITWSPDEEFCVLKIDKKEWLLLFRDNYEKNKFMECVWERWQEIFQCVDLKLLFKKALSCEFERSMLKRYRDHLSGYEAENTEFECV